MKCTYQINKAARRCSLGAQYFAAPFASKTVNSVNSCAIKNTLPLSNTKSAQTAACYAKEALKDSAAKQRSRGQASFCGSVEAALVVLACGA
jgi:hypothetical protein